MDSSTRKSIGADIADFLLKREVAPEAATEHIVKLAMIRSRARAAAKASDDAKVDAIVASYLDAKEEEPAPLTPTHSVESQAPALGAPIIVRRRGSEGFVK